MPVIKVGAEWKLNGRTILRAGISKARQPIDSDQVLFNILAPAVVEKHYTFGFTRALKDGHDFSVALMYAPKNSVSGANPFDSSQILEIEMGQYEIEFGYTF